MTSNFTKQVNTCASKYCPRETYTVTSFWTGTLTSTKPLWFCTWSLLRAKDRLVAHGTEAEHDKQAFWLLK